MRRTVKRVREKSKIKKKNEEEEEGEEDDFFYFLLEYRRPILQLFSFSFCFSFCDYYAWIQFQENSILHSIRSARHTFV